MSHFIRVIAAAALAAVAAQQGPAQCFQQQQELLANDGTSSDELGLSVSLSGNVALVGAWRDDHVANLGGSAYVFRFDGNGWVQEQKLLPPDGRLADFFGWAVDLDGDTAVIGAVGDDDFGDGSGSLYVFRFDGASWQYQTELHASDAAAGDQFGGSVALDGDTLIVGADDDDDSGTDSGSAYVFEREDGVWVERQKLHASTPSSYEHFGFAVDIDGIVAIVGAYGGPSQLFRGTAYIYRFDGVSWQEEDRIWGSQSIAGDFFGASVAVAGDTVLCGARWADINVLDCGEAYVFRNHAGDWIEEQRLAEPAPGGSDGFGYNVALTNGVALVGVPNRDRAVGSRAGHVRLYRHSGSMWVSESPIVPSDPAAEDRFGDGIAVNRSFALIGATWHDHAAPNAGAAYVFDIAACSPATPGDTNCDGAIDAFDIEPFILALTDPNGYATQFPNCDIGSADVNGDGTVDAFDIEPFIALLVGP